VKLAGLAKQPGKGGENPNIEQDFSSRSVAVCYEQYNKEEFTMPKLKCKDVGMKCGFEVKTENQDELMQIVALHAEKSHNMKTIPPDVMEKVKKAIKK
jgi:predicted small metal-binding protein